MESKIAILDTGALIAFLSKNDRFHPWAVATFKKLPPALVTCEAVLSEIFFLLQRDRKNLQLIFKLLEDKSIKILCLNSDLEAVLSLMGKYADMPMSYADACLVRIAETHPRSIIVSTDSDFLTYRIKKNQKIPAVIARGKV